MNRKEIVNGQRIPYELETEALIQMLGSQDMTIFCLACEALSYRSEEQAYSALSSYLTSKDYYRRLYAFQVIFRNPRTASLQWYLDKQLSSEDLIFVRAALHNIMYYQVSCSEEKLKAAVYVHYRSLYDEFYALAALSISDDNYQYLKSLWKVACTSISQEIISKVLIRGYGATKAEELFSLLSASSNPKLRVMAVYHAKENGISTEHMANDVNGHVRKAVKGSKR